MLDAIRGFFRRVGNRIGEAGFHHALVAAALSAPAALIAHEVWAALALWWAGYYWGREQGFAQLRGSYTGVGRLRDVVYVWVYALFSVLVAVLG